MAFCQHLDMHMGSGASAGRANGAQSLAGMHLVAHAHVETLGMGVADNLTDGVFDFDHEAVAAGFFGAGDQTRGQGADGSTAGCGDVDAVVETMVTIDGVGARAEV